MFFKKIKEDINYHKEYYDGKIDRVYETISPLSDKIDKLQRIIKYSKDEPTFRFNINISGYSIEMILYLYINKEEYKIKINDNFSRAEIAEIYSKQGVLKVENNLAYLNVDVVINESNYIYRFIIDYVNKIYVFTKEEVKEIVE